MTIVVQMEIQIEWIAISTIHHIVSTKYSHRGIQIEFVVSFHSNLLFVVIFQGMSLKIAFNNFSSINFLYLAFPSSLEFYPNRSQTLPSVTKVLPLLPRHSLFFYFPIPQVTFSSFFQSTHDIKFGLPSSYPITLSIC